MVSPSGIWSFKCNLCLVEENQWLSSQKSHIFIIKIDWTGPTDNILRFRQQAQLESSTSRYSGSQPFRHAKISQWLYLEKWYLADTYCRGVWSPVCWANLSMCFHKLECFHQAESLFHTTANGEIVDTQMLDDPIWINDEKTSVIEQGVRKYESHSKTKQETRLFQQGNHSSVYQR